jgi:putative ABC transport system ATP-binding protein
MSHTWPTASIVTPRGLAVDLRGATMTFGEGDAQIRALRGIDLHVPAGQFVVVRGRSGSGKTTLFHLIAGLRQPTAGIVRLGSAEISSMGEAESARFRRHHVGLVYQFFNLVPILDVSENVAVPLLLDGRRLRDVQPDVDALLERLGVMHRKHHSVGKLSGGEMQRVAIARALIARPGLLLADEPTGNLDELNAARVLELIAALCRELGATIVLMTHDPGASERADRVIHLRDGQIERDTEVG